jgi:hypothetical protein
MAATLFISARLFEADRLRHQIQQILTLGFWPVDSRIYKLFEPGHTDAATS